MRCKHTKKWADEYLNGTLFEQGKKKLQLHMDNCPSCALYIEELRQMQRLVSDLEQEELPEGFEQRLYQRLQQAYQKTKARSYSDSAWIFRRNRWIKWGAGAAAVSALLLTVYLIRPPGFVNPRNDGNLTAQDNAPEESAENGIYSEGMESPMAGTSPLDSNAEVRQGGVSADLEAELADEKISDAGLPAKVYLYVSKAGNTPDEIAAMAADYHIQAVLQQNNQMILQIDKEAQADTFLERLTELGRVEYSGRNTGQDSITIQMIFE